MGDAWDESFDRSSPYSYEMLRWQRYGHERPLVSGKIILVVVAAVLLLALVGADVTALANRPVMVRITSVSWYAGGSLLTSSSGFSIQASQRTTLTLTCSTVCMGIFTATVGRPFLFLGFTVAYHPIQFVNVTVLAPSSAYSGPLAITLHLNWEATQSAASQ